MERSRQIRWAGLPVVICLMVVSPLLIGQGCPSVGEFAGPNGIKPVFPGDDDGEDPGAGQPLPGTDNTSPAFEFTKPLTTIVRDVGDRVIISWTDEDPDDNAVITLMVDPDTIFGNGNEILIEPSISEDGDRLEDFYELDTRAKNLPPAEYRIIAKINDGVNPEEIVVAQGILDLYPAGLVPGNLSPTIVALEPSRNLAVGHEESFPIEWCASDPDDGENNIIPDIVVLLDLDSNPQNDLNLNSLVAEEELAEICLTLESPESEPYPVIVGDEVRAYVLGCAKDEVDGIMGECAGPDATPTLFGEDGLYTVDVREIPQRENGEPYHVRTTAWDHTNPPVHSYALGQITVAALASGSTGMVDLADVGRGVSGTRFIGFDGGSHAGSSTLSLGDFDEDGADDFIIAARWGQPYNRGNVGSAYLVYGSPGEKLGSEISLNSIGLDYRGCVFAMRETPETDGITTMSTIQDMTGDGRREILFGLPSVESLFDYWDDDPADTDDFCYDDLMPNPLSNGADNDDLSGFDGGDYRYPFGFVEREGLLEDNTICSNDGDLTRQTPITQGYVILVSSDNNLEGTVIELGFVGQLDPGTIMVDEGTIFSGGSSPTGARFRGGWYDVLDFTQTVRPNAIIPDNRFGETIAPLPDLTNGGFAAGRDDFEELLISSPYGFEGRGLVHVIWGQNYTAFNSGEVKSLPRMSGGRGRIFPAMIWIYGASTGDHLGYAGPAGDFNLDGNQDILCGAPGADRDGLVDAGIVYVVFGRLDMGDMVLISDWSQYYEDFDLDDYGIDEEDFEYLPSMNPPRLEIRGTISGQQFGGMQKMVGDLNQDNLPDVAFASQYAGGDGPGGAESGFIGVVFGGRRLTGENFLTVDQVGTPQLPGVRIYGRQAGGHAGAVLDNAGDFNGDGTDDLLLVAPDEIRYVNGLERQGVAYVIFGGPHLTNQSITLSQIGDTVPGIVFVTPYVKGTADEAPIEWAGSAGDVNGDGFDDLLIGIEQADFVNPLQPSLRRVNAGECYLIYGNNTGTNAIN
jgi:hypothetical protein